MISGNCNRSPQYATTMGPGQRDHMPLHGHLQSHYNNSPHFVHQHQHQHQPHLVFMAGGSVGSSMPPQMSRGFTIMAAANGAPIRPLVMQCSMQQGFGGGGGGYQPPPLFQQTHQPQNIHHHPRMHYYQQQERQYQSPQVINYQPAPQQQPFAQRSYISPPPATVSTAPTSGFIDGIKNMVKGFIHPLNCDFYNDHHKQYNPKYRNNYLRDIAHDAMSFANKNPEPRVQSVMYELEVGKAPANQTTYVPTTAVPAPKTKTADVNDVVAIFTSEDFPELPVPRRSRSATPAKTEKTPEPTVKAPPAKESTTTLAESQQPESSSNTPPASVEVNARPPKPKCTFFEIKITTTPVGRRPTFGGRLKVVPPPFSVNKSPRTCRTRRQESTEDCDTEDDSFVMFQRPEDYLFRTLGQCRPVRQRQISECSDDSFVVFCTDDAECLRIDVEDFDDDDDDDEDEDDDDFDSDEEETSSEEEETEDESDSDDDGTDVVDSSFLGRNKTDRNKCAGSTLFHSAAVCDGVAEQLDSGFDEKKRKKVTFDTQPVVHVMHAWNFAYRAARKGPWENVARDRTRFLQRCDRVAHYLNPILTPEHREKIYRSRFCEDVANHQQQKQQKEQPTNAKTEGKTPVAGTASRSDDNQRLPKLTLSPQCANF